MSLYRSPCRRMKAGFSVTELVVAMSILLVAMTAIAQWTFVAARQQGFAQKRKLLAAEAANVMEDLMSRPWAAIEGADAPAIALSAACEHEVPGAHVQVAIEPDEQYPELRRITVRIHQDREANRPGTSVQLVAWRRVP